MAKANSSFSEVQIARRIKEGRGQGHGKDYIPWLTVQEVPSSGRSHRIYSHKTGRVHHLLSDLELAVFLSLEWESSVLDIREQFPLLPSDTRQIAIDSGIKHPVIRGVDQVMSTDFLVDCKDGPFEQFAIQVKPAAALQDERTLEKLELERRYWQQKQIPWFIFTDKEINPVVKEKLGVILCSREPVPVHRCFVRDLRSSFIREQVNAAESKATFCVQIAGRYIVRLCL